MLMALCRRQADRIANYWFARLRDAPPPKRLYFVYLVNDIVQNQKARRRDEFPNAFSPLMPEAVQTAYRSSPQEVQQKIRRVVEVWRSRSVFELPIQEAIESRLEETDKARGSGKKTLMGNSLFGQSASGGMPKELETLGPLQIAVTKATITGRPLMESANAEYEKLSDPNATLPSPPVHAARLSSLLKALANAENSVSESIKARKALIAGLEKILETNRVALGKDETTYLDLTSRKTSTEAKKREVEDGIMRGLPADNSVNVTGDMADVSTEQGRIEPGPGSEPARPDFEALTPEPEESFTPPSFTDSTATTTATSAVAPSTSQLADNPSVRQALANMSAAAVEPITRIRPASAMGQGMNGLSAKRRKTSHDDEMVPDLGEMGVGTDDGGVLRDLDEDVNELLRQESAKI